MNSKKKMIIYIIISIVTIFVASLVISYLLYGLIKLKGSFSFNLKILNIMFKDKFFLSIFCMITLTFFAVMCWVAVKYKMFSYSKVISNNDRVDSNLFDNQQFMTKPELKKEFGYYDITKLQEIEEKEHKEIYGVLANTEFNKTHKTIYASFIKDSHTVLIGTTGTGKSTYQAGPMLQINARTKTKPSFVINDISGELYRRHSWWLKENGYDVHIINLHTPRNGLRFNPLSIIWDLYHQYHDDIANDTHNFETIDNCSNYIEEISNIICPDAKTGEKNWTQGARGILSGIIWGMLEDSLVPEFNFTKEMFTIAQISNIVNRQRAELENFLFKRNENSKVFDCAGIIHNNRNEKGVDSYISSLATALTLFKESGIQYLTSQTDIDFSIITDTPTAIFVIVPPEYPKRNILAGIIYSQIYNMQVFTAKTKLNGALDRPLYFLLDEFGNLPKLNDFHTWIATSRKMRIFFYIMLQSNKQLDDVYSKERASVILNQCQTHLFLGSAEMDDIERLQKMMGTYTAKSRSENIDSTKIVDSTYKGNTSLTKKNLVTISELQQINEGEVYVVQFRKKPIKAHLIADFNNDANNNGLFVQRELQIQKNLSKNIENSFYDLEYRDSFFKEQTENSEEVLQENTDGELTTQSTITNTDSIMNLLRKK